MRSASSEGVPAGAERTSREWFGSLDLLHLNAGIWRPGPIETTDKAAFDALFDVNVKGTFFTLQYAIPVLNDGASVVLTVGAGEGLGAAMTAAKGALLPLVRSMALELAPRRIRVNAVSPGVVEHPRLRQAGNPARDRRGMGRGRPAGPDRRTSRHRGDRCLPRL